MKKLGKRVLIGLGALGGSVGLVLATTGSSSATTAPVLTPKNAAAATTTGQATICASGNYRALIGFHDANTGKLDAATHTAEPGTCETVSLAGLGPQHYTVLGFFNSTSDLFGVAQNSGGDGIVDPATQRLIITVDGTTQTAGQGATLSKAS